MGVNGLTGILKRYAPKAILDLKTSHFKNQTIAVDASCHLNKFLYSVDPHPHKYIYGFYLLSLYFDMNNIQPVFVFDGINRIEAKKHEQEKRDRQRLKVSNTLKFEQEQADRLNNLLKITEEIAGQLPVENATKLKNVMDNTLNQVDNAISTEVDSRVVENQLIKIAQSLKEAVSQVEDTEKYTKTARNFTTRENDLVADLLMNQLQNVRSSLQSLSAENHTNRVSLEKRSLRVTQEMRDECQNFLQELGYVCFSCENHEAEAMCAHLGKAGRTCATVSEDLDTLVFGDQPLIRNFFSRQNSIMVIDPVIARKQLKLSKKSFLDFCILSGTDFSSTISGIGPIKALQYIQKYKTIEKILPILPELNSKYIIQSGFDYTLARKVFKKLPPIPTEDSAYKKPRTNTVEADLVVSSAVFKESVVDGTNPFKESAFL